MPNSSDRLNDLDYRDALDVPMTDLAIAIFGTQFGADASDAEIVALAAKKISLLKALLIEQGPWNEQTLNIILRA